MSKQKSISNKLQSVKSYQSQQCILKTDPIKSKIEKDSKLEVEEIVKSYKTGIPVKEIAKVGEISYNKVIKLLVTEGVYTSDTYDKIKDLRAEGKSEREISDICGLGKSAMWQYTPYTRGIYNSENPTENAIKIREWRARKLRK